MKLSSLYTNDESLFKKIYFNDGLNVIFAKITKPLDQEKDSHNLGKTTLIDVIDFCLLKEVSKDYFLIKNKDRFGELIFFLEIQLENGQFLTIKRGVEQNTKISLKVSPNKNSSFIDLTDKEWDHCKVAIDTAKNLVDSFLNLMTIKPWDYRKGLTYFLRKQKDYNDVFQIDKFSSGRHRDWKPYIAKLLGLNYKIIEQKYDADYDLEKLTDYRTERKKQLIVDVNEYDKLKASLEIKKTYIAEQESKLEKFNFFEEDLNVNENLVNEIEDQISIMNNNLYNINFDINKIRESLSTKLSFSIEQVKTVFNEVGILFKDELTKSYEDLVDFNKKLTLDRNKRFEDRLKVLDKQKEESEIVLKDLDAKRSEALSILSEKDSFKKFKKMQTSLGENRAEVILFETQLAALDELVELDKKIKELSKEVQDLKESINVESKRDLEALKEIRKEFNRIIKKVLDNNGIVYLKVNESGNIDFKAEISEGDFFEKETFLGEGTSYKKIRCVAFDLAVLKFYKNKGFYSFVYHDGIFEGLDNRKKMKLLEVIKEYSNSFGIQYIFSIIDTDLPRDNNDKKIYFEASEIVRELHDDGDNGRLFIGPIF